MPRCILTIMPDANDQGLSDIVAEGRNVRIEGRWAEGQYGRLPAAPQHGVALHEQKHRAGAI